MNTISKKSLLIFVAFFSLLTVLTPWLVRAELATSTPPVVERVCLEVPLPNLPGLPADPCSSPAAYIQYWFYFALYLAGIAALVMLVAGGVMYMISSTVPGAGKGTKYIINALLGFILLFGSYVLLRTLGGEQFITLKNPQLPSLPVCAIDFSPFPTKVDRKTEMTWTIDKNGATKNAKDTTINCANSDFVNNEPQSLEGKITFKPLKEGKTSCTFNIHDANGTHLHECTATADVLPEDKIDSCILTKDGRYFFWTPKFDKEQWIGTFTCKGNDGHMTCSNSPCIVSGKSDITFMEIFKSGKCTLDEKNKTEKKISCSTSWGNQTPSPPSCAIMFSPTPTTVGIETRMDWTIDKNGTEAVKTNIICENPDLNLASQPLQGEEKIIPIAEGKTSCIFDIQDTDNTSLNKCTAEVNVSPKDKKSSCILTHAPSVISWNPDFDTNIPDFDKRKWTGSLACQEAKIKCPLSPVSECNLTAWRGGASASLIDDNKGKCTLTMKNKETNEVASCSVSLNK